MAKRKPQKKDGTVKDESSLLERVEKLEREIVLLQRKTEALDQRTSGLITFS